MNKSNTIALAAFAALALAGAARAEQATYEIDPTHTFPKFEVSHMGFSNHTGLFTKTRGTVKYDPQGKTGSMEVVVEPTGVSTGVEHMENFLRSKTFFNVEQYPTVSYRGKKFIFDGDKLASVEGELTLLGVTKPVNLALLNFRCGPNPISKKEECGGNATGQIKRSEFGMTGFLPGVGDEVKLNIQFEAYKQ